jgi:hypothetical protein
MSVGVAALRELQVPAPAREIRNGCLDRRTSLLSNTLGQFKSQSQPPVAVSAAVFEQAGSHTDRANELHLDACVF